MATVRQVIERARRERWTSLDLSVNNRAPVDEQHYYKLDEIPPEVFDLQQLEELVLNGQNIRTVPERVRELTKLKWLSLVDNPIESVPDIGGLVLDWETYERCRNILLKRNIKGIWIELDKERPFPNCLTSELLSLPRLASLSVVTTIFNFTPPLRAEGEILEFVKSLSEFRALEVLVFFGLLLEDFPVGIQGLKALSKLILPGNGLRKIPDWVGDLTQLTSLNLSMNELDDLPASLANLNKLEYIDLGRNRFTEIPKVVFRLENLSRLIIEGDSLGGHSSGDWTGRITRIPAEILQLPKLNYLDVERQPVEIPPPEVVKEGLEAIKNYWRQQQEVGVDYLCEAKLIIVGEAGAGKTSLAKKLQNPGCKLEPDERSTEGIEVVRWSFPSIVRAKRDGREELHNADFKVNIWDFGGQEIYHATHQFFLTRRSLYALVADDRKEDTDFNYWLAVVELLSDRSPLLIVQNEKQDRQRDIDLGGLRAHFPNFREAFRTNLATNRGLPEIEKAIKRELEQLPHIGTPLPKTWSRVRRALENDPRNHISIEEYSTICQENGFTRRLDKLQLSGYLHDLGICLHFQEDPILKNIVILKPKWGTGAVYRVLDDHAVLDNRGRFGPNDLLRIWSDDEYSSMRDELLRLMMRFQLCYKLPDTEAYIAPQLLSPSRPPYELEGRGGLVLRYEYDFMPKGILTRFIVAVNHLIENGSLVWKSGVVLARHGSRAEVVEDYPRRRITVRVSGADLRGLLAIVDDQLDRIHTSFPRLRYDKLLPCNCAICQTRDDPFAYPLTELKDFAAQGDKIQCRVSRKLVDAAALIGEVLPSAVPLPEAIAAQTDFEMRTSKSAESPPIKEVFVS
jgi:internalin A